MKIRNLIIGFVAALVLTGCGSELGLASRFVVQSQQVQAAVYFPEKASVTLIPNGEGAYTQVLDSLNQDAFLDIMYLAYADEMGRFGVNVYVPNDPDHVQVDSTHWLVMLSNMEIQGLFLEYVERYFDLADEYVFPYSLNAVNVASWFDINDGEWHPALFDEHNLTDNFDTGDVIPIKNNDLYDYAVYLGKRYAAFTYNYMMNRYIQGEMGKKGNEPRFQLRWDPYEESLFFLQEGEGFVELTVED